MQERFSRNAAIVQVLFDMGFIEEIERVISYAPAQRQTLLFSATFPEEILSLSSSIQNDAVSVKTISNESANKITEHFYGVEEGNKLSTLINILGKYEPETTIVFANTKIECQEIHPYLRIIA